MLCPSQQPRGINSSQSSGLYLQELNVGRRGFEVYNRLRVLLNFNRCRSGGSLSSFVFECSTFRTSIPYSRLGEKSDSSIVAHCAVGSLPPMSVYIDLKQGANKLRQRDDWRTQDRDPNRLRGMEVRSRYICTTLGFLRTENAHISGSITDV
jgi:hypothetical protein